MLSQELPISVDERVALAGDAAHAMTPYLGLGAGHWAVEGVYMLAVLLARPLTTHDTVCNVLKIYEAICPPHGNMVHQLSRLSGTVYVRRHLVDNDLGQRSRLDIACSIKSEHSLS